jgi:TonB-dependent receptor
LNDFPGMESMTPEGFLSDVVDLNTTQWLTPDREYLLDNRGEIRVAMGYEDELPAFIPAQFFDNDEDSYAAYVKANYGFEVAGMALDGQVGARLLRLDSTLRGTRVNNGTPQPIDIDSSDTTVLPSASARLMITEELQARAAVSKTVTRPGFSQLNPSTAYFQPTSTSTFGYGSGGNPNLESIEANNYDISLEWYFAQGSSLTGAYFYRDIEGYINNYVFEETVDGVLYNITRPENTGDGTLKGFELAYTQFFDMLPSFWSGFGVQANATFMDGETETQLIGSSEVQVDPLANVSDESYNLVLLYELDKVSARIAYNWRSDYYAGFNQTGAQPGRALIVKDSDSLDMAVNYDMTDNLTFSVEATNLTDSVYGDYFGGDSAADEYLYPRDTYARERTYSVGVRFHF